MNKIRKVINRIILNTVLVVGIITYFAVSKVNYKLDEQKDHIIELKKELDSLKIKK